MGIYLYVFIERPVHYWMDCVLYQMWMAYLVLYEPEAFVFTSVISYLVLNWNVEQKLKIMNNMYAD